MSDAASGPLVLTCTCNIKIYMKYQKPSLAVFKHCVAVTVPKNLFEILNFLLHFIQCGFEIHHLQAILDTLDIE